ncbi:MAG: carbohydrate binding domain-containing protein [Clostridia bacterium]|nr:carbohydrate binding domain-containing protein [Clostridia bacterium]
MKKISLILAAILLMGLFTALPASAAISISSSVITEAEATLIPNVNAVEGFSNSGFESALSSYNWEKIGTSANTVERSTDAKNGSYSLKITNAESASDSTQTGAHNNFKIIPGVTYEISAWFKSEKTTGSAELHGLFYGTDENGNSVGYSRMHLYFSISFNDWTKKIIRFTAPVHSTSLTIYCYNKGPGTVYFDDVSAMVPKEAVPALNIDEPKEPVEGMSPLFSENFENFDAGYYYHQSSSQNPGIFAGHHVMVSDAVPNAETGSSKSLKFLHGSNPNQGSFNGLANFYSTGSLNLVPGAVYQVSALVNTPTFGTSSTFAIWVSFDVEESGSDITKKSWTLTHYPWWRRVVFEFEVPLDVTSATFQLRYSSSVNPLYVDDFSAYMVDAPAHAFVESDELFYYSEWEEGYVSASANSYYGSELVGGRVEYKFYDTDGETVLESCAVPYANGEATYTFRTGLMVKKTERYYIGAKVYSGQGALVQEERLHVYRFDRPTYLGADGIFRKNGKEYNIVLGNGVNTERLNKDPRTGGVTVVQIIADPSNMGTTTKDRMDLAHSMGLLCLINFYGGTNGGAPEAIEKTINTVSWAKNHPALFGYKVQDEPYQKGEPDEDMERAYARIRKEDPNHPVYLDDSVPGGYKWLYRYADIIDIDYYGGRSSEPGKIFTERLELAAQATKGRKPFSLLQQAFKFNGYLPTVDELRSFTYQAFFAGASAFGYHTLGVDGSDGVETCYMDSEDWAELGERWAPWEQGFLFDAFVNDKFELLRSYRDDNVMWKTFRDGEDIYAVMFNRLRDSAATVSIPLTDANGVSLIGRYSAYRAAGTKGAEPVYVTGNNTLNVTLGGIVARNDKMELVPREGMAAEIWKISPDNNLLPNGSFEADFTDGVPTAAWTAGLGYGSGGSVSVGTISQLSSDTHGDIEISPAVDGSFKFMKLQRYNPSTGNLTDNRPTRLSIPISSIGLESGKSYRFEGYFNIPYAVEGAGMHFTSNINSNDGDSISLSTGFVQRGVATSGWEKRSYDFVYRGGTYYLNLEIDNTSGPGAIYFDELKIYEIDSFPASFLSVDCRFDADQNASAFSTGSSVSVDGANFDIVQDPDDPSNYALMIPDKKLTATSTNNTANPVKLPLNSVSVSNLSVNDFLKYSFRIKVAADEVPANDLVISGRYNNSNFVNVTNKYIDVSYTIPKDKVNTWVDVEFITNAPASSDKVLFAGRLAGYDYYIDDIMVTKVEGSFASAVKPLNMINNSQGTYFAKGAVGIKEETYSATDAANRRIYFVPASSTDSAFAAVALYKVENNVKTLIDVDAESMVASSLWPVVTGNDFGIDLSGQSLTDGTYIVEYFLWNLSFETAFPKITYSVIND